MNTVARIAIATAVIAIVQSPAALALHRCVGKDGKVTYTEFECDADAKKSAVTIRDSSGVGPQKSGEPAKDAKGPQVLGGPTLVRPADSRPMAIQVQPGSVQSAGHGSAVGAPVAAKPGQ